MTAPDNVWAIDAHDGHELWRYFWKTRGGTHIGNRGAGMWNNYLFFETPDNYLVSLDARTGKERWHVEIASFDEQYFSTRGAGHRRQPRPRRHRQRPRLAGLPAVVRSGNRQAAVEDLHRADETGRSRSGHLAEPRRGAARRRADLDSRRLRSGDEALHHRHRQPDARLHRRRDAWATTSSPARWSRSTSTPARWPGTTRPRRTTRTTGTRRRRRS